MIWLWIAVWLGALWVGLAWGQIYKWTDRQGNVYFTDNASHIPPAYRSTVEVERASPPVPLQAPSDEAAKAPPPDATAASEPPSAAPLRDRLGRGPDHWQRLAQQWSARLQQHLHDRDRLQLLYRYTQTLASSTRDVRDRGRLQAEMARLEKAIAEAEAQINEADTMLRTTLPLEARQLGANPGWLQPPAATQQ
jgi:hypothetical protein